MTTEAAGKVNVVLSVNQVNFTAAMKEAQANLDKFSGKAKAAGHATVNSTQAASAALRVMQGNMTNNIRAVERFVGAIPGVGTALKVAFPLVGGIAFGSLIVDMGMKVAAFIKTVDEMPKTIQKGFEALALSQKTANDELDVTNDKLQNSIDKLEKKPTDGLKLGMDEAKLSADHLAESISGASDKLNELLSKNHISAMQALWGMWGTVSTASVEGTSKYFNQKISTASSNYADDPSAKNHSALIAAITAAIKEATATANKEIARRNAPASTAEKFAGAAAGLSGPLNLRPDNSNVILDAQNSANYYKGMLRTDSATTKNQGLQKQQDADTDKKNAAELAKQQTEQAKAAATARVAVMQSGLDAMKLQYGMSIKATYDYWDQMKASELAGGTAYNEIVKKQSELAVQAASKAHETIQKAIADAKRKGAEDSTTGPALINSSTRFMQDRAQKTSADRDADARDSNRMFMDGASNSARLEEAQITDAAGDSMTRYAAAVALANVHATELKATLLGLGANVDIAQKNYDDANTLGGDPDKIRQTKQALDAAKGAYGNAQTTGAIQRIQDNKSIDPGFTSATTGAKDALNDFVKASRDSAAMMRDLVTNTLQGLNSQVTNAMFGDKTNFGQVAKNAGKQFSNDALTKLEGSVLGKFGFGSAVGKPGQTKGNPLFVSVVNGGVNGGGSKGLFDSISGSGDSDDTSDSSGSGSSGVMGFVSKIGSWFTSNGKASGGYIDGPTLVGEKGPEVIDAKGYVTPNNKLATSSPSGSGSQQNVTYSIDARGTDPVQTEQRVRQSIAAAHQSAVVQSVKQVQQNKVRTPQRSR